MPNEIAAFVGRVQTQSHPHELDDLVEGARARGAQEGFQFGKGQFDRVEVRAIRRQEAQVRAHPRESRLDGRLLMDREIVQDDDVSGVQRRYEYLLDVGEKRRIVERPIEHRGGRHPVDAQRRDDGVRLPVAARRVIAQPSAPRAAPVAAQQIGCDTGLIQEDIAGRVVQRLRVAPVATRRRYIGPPLFVRVYRFF